MKDGTHGTHTDSPVGPYLLSAKNIKNGKIKITNEDRKISQDEFDRIHSRFSLKKGDILLTIVGSIGEAAILSNPEGITFQRSVAYLRSDVISPKYLYTYITSPEFQKELKNRQVVSAQPGIYLGDLDKIPISIPEESREQQKIGLFFSKIDVAITLHQQKYELVFRLKQAYLQLMFPQTGESTPKVRFADFHDSWEQRKLGELSPLRGGFAFKSDRFTNAGIPIVRISNILKDGSVGGEFAYYDLQRDDENYSLSDKSVLLAMSGATTGKVAILENPNNNKVYQNQRVGYFTRKQNTNYSFISVLVRSKLFLDQLNSVLVAGAQPNVSSRDIDGFEFFKPSNIEEQQKIGNFFKQLDATLTLHQQKVASLKSLKQAYLQKMFV